MRPVKLGILLLIILFLPSAAMAARPAKIIVKKAIVFEEPKAGSEIVDELQEGDEAAVSSYPTEGFHKIRTPDGKIGWIRAHLLELGPIPDPPPGQSASAQSASAQSVSVDSLDEPGRKIASLPTNSKFHLSAFGGLVFMSATGVVTNGTLTLSNTIGGELSLFFRERFAAVLRTERISKALLASDATTGKTFAVTLGSLPVSLGVTWRALATGRWWLDFSVMGGVAPLSYIRSTVSDSSLTSVEASTIPLTGLAKMTVSHRLSPLLSVFAEAGYRYLTFPTISGLNSADTAGLIFESSFNLNMGGLISGLGLTFSF